MSKSFMPYIFILYNFSAMNIFNVIFFRFCKLWVNHHFRKEIFKVPEGMSAFIVVHLEADKQSEINTEYNDFSANITIIINNNNRVKIIKNNNTSAYYTSLTTTSNNGEKIYDYW